MHAQASDMPAQRLPVSPSFQAGRLTDLGSRPRRYTLCTTLRCNLACTYCYVDRNSATMSLATARQSLDFIFRHAPSDSKIEIGFFGGEPLLEFPLLKDVTALIEDHSSFDPARVKLTITTNGTVYTDSIGAFLRDHLFKVCVSCDGAPHVQNLFRRTALGNETAALVERTLLAIQQALPIVLVNAVYNPQSLPYLPETLDYLSGLGLRYIYLNPDYSARWTRQDAEQLGAIYRALGERYIAWYLKGDPHLVSMIDTKITVLLRGGYSPLERCSMGVGELTVTPDGGLYPCERLVGSGTDDTHRIGSVEQGLDLSRMMGGCAPGGSVNPECADCSMKDSCMNWCGCSNAFMTGYYNRVGPFLCASERAAIRTALEVFSTLEKQLGPTFLHHFSGEPQVNSQLGQKGVMKIK